MTTRILARFATAVLLALCHAAFAQQPGPKPLVISEHYNAEAFSAFVQKNNLPAIEKLKINQALETRDCNDWFCPITLSITRIENICFIIPSPYAYRIPSSTKTIIKWSINSPGFIFHSSDPILFSRYADPYLNDAAQDLLYPTFRRTDTDILTFNLHLRKREIHYDFQIDYFSVDTYKPCILVDPIIYNM